MNGSELRAKFIPHYLISYHMEEQDCSALQCNTVRSLTYIVSKWADSKTLILKHFDKRQSQ